jgi:cysteine-rich protein
MGEKITFWYGCNVLRHGDIVHSCLDILKRLGYDAQPAGGPDYCCGSSKDANQQAADGMARRTVGRFNQIGRERVVAWCPSCHTHMTEFMGRAYEPEFGLGYFVDLLYENLEALKPQLVNHVPMRVMLHRHVGFNDRVAVNDRVPELLRAIPGVEVVEDDYRAPGYMCSLLNAVPGAMDDMFRATVEHAHARKAGAVVSIFHQCHRELLGLDAAGEVEVFNYVQLIARSMGLPYVDEYKQWKRAGPNAAAAIGEARVAQVGVQFFERAMLPELVKRPVGLAAKKKDPTGTPFDA